MPSTSQLALDLMCGEWGASRCSPTKWFKYMGDPETLYVPFEINYIVTPNVDPIGDIIPNDPPIVPCHEALNVRIIFSPTTIQRGIVFAFFKRMSIYQ